MQKNTRIVLAIATVSVGYATLRYNVLKGVPWSDWPIYILNKAAALSSLLLLVTWIVRARGGPDKSHQSLLTVASRFMLVHAGLSLAILTPSYFPSFFVDGKLTWQAGASVLIGVMAATGLYFRSRSGGPRSVFLPGLGVLAFMAGVHAMLYGYASWLAPAAWPGYTVPITMIAFAAGVVGIASALTIRRDAGVR